MSADNEPTGENRESQVDGGVQDGLYAVDDPADHVTISLCIWCSKAVSFNNVIDDLSANSVDGPYGSDVS